MREGALIVSDARQTNGAGEVGRLVSAAGALSAELEGIRSRLGASGVDWYPYDTLANLQHLDGILSAGRRDLLELAGGEPVVDIGGADGELAFLLERAGAATVDFVDHAATNHNRMRGVHALRDALGSRVTIADVDLDRRFALPRPRYGLAVFLGILYHLKNPYGALENLAKHARWALISTRVASHTTDRSLLIRDQPLAYLLDPREANDDATNYWIFTVTGLRRLLGRCGWVIADFGTVGSTMGSDPASPEGDERAFLLAKSSRFQQGPRESWSPPG